MQKKVQMTFKLTQKLLLDDNLPITISEMICEGLKCRYGVFLENFCKAFIQAG